MYHIEPAKPLYNAQIGGSFYLFMTIPFTKPYKNTSDLVSILKKRGLIIYNEAKAINYLNNIGYFRLSAYFYPLLKIPKADHIFKNDSTFEQALDLYRFDRKLRVLIFNEIEKIEVAIRSVMINTACNHLKDIFWITDNRYFYNQTYFQNSIAEIDSELSKSKEDFIKHFDDAYSDTYPPAWMISEILPLGNICRIYKNLNDFTLKKKIAGHFQLHPKVFESWLMTISGLRNICCHHSRLWNRVFPVQAIAPKNTKNSWVGNSFEAGNDRVYFRICIIRYILFSVSPNNTFKEKLIDLLSKYPNVDINAMGFTPDWSNKPLWK